MITRYVKNGFVEKALETFKQMQLACIFPVMLIITQERYNALMLCSALFDMFLSVFREIWR